ncbi:zf-HC2 domain-containing protein [Solirubrobacter ginsenosidimutans]|uniref:Zf-HC2 domain-containing protein n=1 Tax=Solirubrobacter ginsenosidimutans TaxID=490573 RepID=A0A9X3S3X9_9ACTN|nr:zf-HC2 domain-containing protein [Solirubrobacter ginsenosidimutans]MDA0162571.1 zf-HC2 domain-containing protein [Solirubrobacter ginsenosidimutans]
MTSNGRIIPGGISCREVVELVTEYLDGALSDADTERMEEHLKLCPPCVEYVDQIRATAQLAAVAAVELELRPDRDTLLRVFREFKAGG